MKPKVKPCSTQESAMMTSIPAHPNLFSPSWLERFAALAQAH
jgi:hypothetical protein